MDIKLWTQLSGEFEARYDRCTKAGGSVDLSFIAPTLIKAGKRLYELLNSCPVEGFEFYDEIKSIPAFPLPFELEGKGSAERYASYWLWTLVGLAKSGDIELANPELRSLFFHPMEVGELLGELPIDAHLKDRHTPFDTGYIQDICLGSQQLCKKILNQLEENGIDRKKLSETEIHIEINKHSRKLTIGNTEYALRGRKLWAFIEELVASKRQTVTLPRYYEGEDYKNAVDTLRRTVKNETLHIMIHFTRNGYELKDHVRLEGFSSISIKPTWTKRTP